MSNLTIATYAGAGQPPVDKQSQIYQNTDQSLVNRITEIATFKIIQYLEPSIRIGYGDLIKEKKDFNTELNNQLKKETSKIKHFFLNFFFIHLVKGISRSVINNVINQVKTKFKTDFNKTLSNSDGRVTLLKYTLESLNCLFKPLEQAVGTDQPAVVTQNQTITNFSESLINEFFPKFNFSQEISNIIITLEKKIKDRSTSLILKPFLNFLKELNKFILVVILKPLENRLNSISKKLSKLLGQNVIKDIIDTSIIQIKNLINTKQCFNAEIQEFINQQLILTDNESENKPSGQTQTSQSSDIQNIDIKDSEIENLRQILKSVLIYQIGSFEYGIDALTDYLLKSIKDKYSNLLSNKDTIPEKLFQTFMYFTQLGVESIGDTTTPNPSQSDIAESINSKNEEFKALLPRALINIVKEKAIGQAPQEAQPRHFLGKLTETVSHCFRQGVEAVINVSGNYAGELGAQYIIKGKESLLNPDKFNLIIDTTIARLTDAISQQTSEYSSV